MTDFVSSLILAGCLCLLIVIYLCCRPGAPEKTDDQQQQQSFFTAHDPQRLRRDRAQLAEFHADNRIARGCHRADLRLWETEEPVGVDPRQPAQPETDGPRPGTGTVTP